MVWRGHCTPRSDVLDESCYVWAWCQCGRLSYSPVSHAVATSMSASPPKNLRHPLDQFPRGDWRRQCCGKDGSRDVTRTMTSTCHVRLNDSHNYDDTVAGNCPPSEHVIRLSILSVKNSGQDIWQFSLVSEYRSQYNACILAICWIVFDRINWSNARNVFSVHCS
jgi:hypothetical protein